MASQRGPWRAPEKYGDPAPPPAHVRAPGPDGSPEAPDGNGSTPPPEDIHIAWVLWLAAAAIGVVGKVLSAVTARFADYPQETRDVITEAVEQAGRDAPAVETIFTLATVVGAVLAVVAAVATVWFAFRLRAGRKWARLLLDLVSVFLIVDAVAVVIAVFGGTAMGGSGGQVVSFVVISCQILAGLCAANAVWRQHTSAAVEYTGGTGVRR